MRQVSNKTFYGFVMLENLHFLGHFHFCLTQNDLFFMCSMIECVARKIHQRNKCVVNALGYENLYHLISLANVLHCENPDKVVDD